MLSCFAFALLNVGRRRFCSSPNQNDDWLSTRRYVTAEPKSCGDCDRRNHPIARFALDKQRSRNFSLRPFATYVRWRQSVFHWRLQLVPSLLISRHIEEDGIDPLCKS